MVEQLYILPILLFSVVIHEVAHGYMALKLGDPTAKMLGRLTLNPLPHIDPIGSIFIPLFSLLTAGGVFIAWAKPVPVDPTNFLRPRRDDFLVSIVGPTSNLLVAFVCSVAVILLGFVGATVNTAGSALAIDGLEFLTKMFYGGIYLNIVLAVFNLIPVPPLDGSHVLAAFLPARLARGYRSVGFAGILLIIFLMRVPAVSGTFHAVIEGIFAPFHTLISLFT
ncbi:MAG TPA: site-2 protease family protein [Bacteroidetes bacterium]|nr:site-2 protease family protein [Bacteroidota bacterium]